MDPKFQATVQTVRRTCSHSSSRQFCVNFKARLLKVFFDHAQDLVLLQSLSERYSDGDPPKPRRLALPRDRNVNPLGNNKTAPATLQSF